MCGVPVDSDANRPVRERLLMLQTIGEIEVEVSPHAPLNTTKGVVVCRDLLNCTEEDITIELAPVSYTHLDVYKRQALHYCR